MSPTFQPPTVDTVPPFLPSTQGPARRLMRHYKARARGRSLVKVAGVWILREGPDTSGLIEGTDLFLGGHVYVVSDAVATALTTAGFGSGLSVAADWGDYGSVTWASLDIPNRTWESL